MQSTLRLVLKGLIDGPDWRLRVVGPTKCGEAVGQTTIGPSENVGKAA